MSYISFPGLGIEPFHIDKAAFTVFGRDVAWYGILITCGMLIAIAVAFRLIKFEHISADDLIDLALYAIIFGVIGARLYYVIFSWNEFDYLVTSGSFFYNLWHSFVNIIAIWEGGLAIYGGVIGGMIVGIVFAKVKKIHFLKVFDILAPSVMIGQIIGRWGNFVNMEAHGTETTLPWRMGLLFGNAETGEWLTEQYVHPTFFYESLWNLIGLIIILSLYKKKKANGQIFAMYFAWYGFGRMFIEGLRTDSLMLTENIRVSQLVGLVTCVIGILLLIFLPKIKSLKVDAENTEPKTEPCEDK